MLGNRWVEVVFKFFHIVIDLSIPKKRITTQALKDLVVGLYKWTIFEGLKYELCTWWWGRGFKYSHMKLIVDEFKYSNVYVVVFGGRWRSGTNLVFWFAYYKQDICLGLEESKKKKNNLLNCRIKSYLTIKR